MRPAPAGPLHVRVSGGRMFAVVRTRLEDFRKIRAEQGGTVNDVVLACIIGALLPMAVRDAEYSTPGLVGNQVAAYLVDLPVGEANPVLRLQHIGHAMADHLNSGRSVATRALLTVCVFAPATLHSLGARAAGTFSSRIFNLIITNSPGPQVPLYAGQARMVEMFPVRNQALAISVTSYHGGVYFGLNGDRKAVSDVDVIAVMIEESLEELKGAHW